jgi:hypothetical protein
MRPREALADLLTRSPSEFIQEIRIRNKLRNGSSKITRIAGFDK